MGRKLDKFLLLMWKNWVLQYRRPIQTIVEILAPVIFSILLVLVRSGVNPEAHDALVFNPYCSLPLNISGICDIETNNATNLLKKAFTKKFWFNYSDNDDTNYFKKFDLIYSPRNQAINETLQPLTYVFRNVVGLDNSQDLETYYATHGSNSTFAALQFDDSLYSKDTLGSGKYVDLAIRFPGELRTGEVDEMNQKNWRTNLVFPLLQIEGPRAPDQNTGAVPNYYKEGFLALQHMVSILITWKQAGVTIPADVSNRADWFTFLQNHRVPFISMRRFPHNAWQLDVLLTVLETYFSLIIMLSFIYTCINTVKSITQEKEKQLKEAMKIMGLPNWLHWTAWFFKTFAYLMISIILMVALLKFKWYSNTDYSVFTYANPFVLIIFLVCYVIATITFCFAVSVFFSKANTAAAIGGLMWFLSYALYMLVSKKYDSLTLFTKLTTSLSLNTAMGFGFQIILMYEGTSEGIQFSNIWKPISSDDNLSLGVVIVMLLVDALIYLLIALYAEAVFPGEYGVPQKWYFPFTSEFWCGQPRYTGVEDLSDDSENEGKFFEAEPRTQETGIKIRNLRKTFGNKAAVRNLSLNMYEDHITVLLGHNGAGKTTTMSMLTGMFPPTTGTALVGGYDIRTNMEGVRNSLGLCPQHNIIFDDLTVEEHLYFFSKLKGLKGKDIDAEITKYIDLLELQPKRKIRSSKLSGGMKRKLCVGMALCGNSKIVMLDEPTAGMDPSARRALWDLLLSQKTGRTILLSTHFMDEADLLGDRIAIMAGGELQCCGSSFFLKKKYGAGYHLIMDKSNECSADKVTAVLRKHIPNIEAHSNIGSELTYLLAESQSYIFQSMLEDLENHSKELGINSYGISLTTLEEVFMKVGADHGQEEMYNGVTPLKEINGNNPNTNISVSLAPGSLSSFQLIINQLLAMTMKKILSTIRSWILLVIQMIMPIIFLMIVLISSRNQNQVGNLVSMPLNLGKFDEPVVLVEGMNDEYLKLYKEIVGSAYEHTDSINATMIRLTAEAPVTARRRYVVGASITPFSDKAAELKQVFDVNITAYFNNDPYHSPGVSLGLALNAIYRKVVKCSGCGINFVNYPLPYQAETQVTQLQTGNNMGYQLALYIGLSMAFVSSFYILFVVRERISKSKHLQFVSGVKVWVFWLTTWFWDFITYIATIIVLLITIIAFQEDGFKTAGEVGRMFFVLLYFGWAMLPMMYVAGFLFDVPSTGFIRMTFFSIFTVMPRWVPKTDNYLFDGVQVLDTQHHVLYYTNTRASIPAFIIVQIIGLFNGLEKIGNTLHWIFLAVPHYSLSSGILGIYTTYFYNNMCNTYYEMCYEQNPTFNKTDCVNTISVLQVYCENVDDNYFKWASPGIGKNLLYSFGIGSVLLVALILKDYKTFSKLTYIVRQKYFSTLPADVEDEDADVQAEKHKIRNIPEAELTQNYSMVLKNLTKYYKKFLAVNGLSLGVNKCECFGLLGINGAGKTTTFQMLTGDAKVSYGDAWVNGHSIRHDIKQVQKSIGYCPQFDALLDDLTARETLTMFALLRGISLKYCNQIALKLSSDFDYQRHLDKKVKELSGGNKRKLSTSIALIGDPPVLYLDEPTTGMDPGTKRFLWNVLCHVRDCGKTIVLTSHSMEECEALCTRLAIMVNGNFKCLGSTQHLKDKFAEGYTITVKGKKPESSMEVKQNETEQIEKFMMEKFPSAILREKHEKLLTYYVTDKTVPWSKMFGILEEGKRQEDLCIEDYSLGQSSLEQVFLSFTKHQIETD